MAKINRSPERVRNKAIRNDESVFNAWSFWLEEKAQWYQTGRKTGNDRGKSE
jgi:hypothetical protein